MSLSTPGQAKREEHVSPLRARLQAFSRARVYFAGIAKIRGTCSLVARADARGAGT